MKLVELNLYDDINKKDFPIKNFEKTFESQYWTTGHWDSFDLTTYTDNTSLDFEVSLKSDSKSNIGILTFTSSETNEIWAELSGTNDAMSCTVNLSCLNNSINVTFSKVKIANQNYDLQEIDKRTKDLSLTKMSINNSFQSLVD